MAGDIVVVVVVVFDGNIVGVVMFAVGVVSGIVVAVLIGRSSMSMCVPCAEDSLRTHTEFEMKNKSNIEEIMKTLMFEKSSLQRFFPMLILIQLTAVRRI